jgi:hypothetical protein
VGLAHCALIKNVEITTNLAWDGALRNERLFEAVHGVIGHCERSHATTIDTAKYFVDLNSYAPPISVPRKPLDREWAANPQLASYKRRIAAHELFVLPVRGFHCLPNGKQDDELLRLNVTIKVESRTPSSPLRSSLRSGIRQPCRRGQWGAGADSAGLRWDCLPVEGAAAVLNC